MPIIGCFTSASKKGQVKERLPMIIVISFDPKVLMGLPFAAIRIFLSGGPAVLWEGNTDTSAPVSIKYSLLSILDKIKLMWPGIFAASRCRLLSFPNRRCTFVYSCRHGPQTFCGSNSDLECFRDLWLTVGAGCWHRRDGNGLFDCTHVEDNLGGEDRPYPDCHVGTDAGTQLLAVPRQVKRGSALLVEVAGTVEAEE